VAVFFIAHPAKPPPASGGDARAPGLYSISGSAHWVNKPEWGIVVHRGWDPDGGRGRTTQIHVRKVKYRWFGRPGMRELDYDPLTGRYADRRAPVKAHPGHAD
jgi:twinkle protein